MSSLHDRDSCGDPLPKDKFVKGDLPLVRYMGFVLPESFVMSGLMERVAEFETRPDDLIIAGFPRSGTSLSRNLGINPMMVSALLGVASLKDLISAFEQK